MAEFLKRLIPLLIVGAAAAGKLPMDLRDTQKEDSFSKFDKNGDGFLSKNEIVEKRLSWDAVSVYDLNNDQRISRDEFDILVKVANKDAQETSSFKNFRFTDSNHNGLVTAAELKARLAKAQLNFSLNAMQNEIGLQDQNNDGQLNYNEFKKFWQRLLAYVKQQGR